MFYKPTLFLPKAEYAEVIHEINNRYDAVYKGKRYGIIKLATKDGYMLYYFQIVDFNEYNIYEKVKF